MKSDGFLPVLTGFLACFCLVLMAAVAWLIYDHQKNLETAHAKIGMLSHEAGKWNEERMRLESAAWTVGEFLKRTEDYEKIHQRVEAMEQTLYKVTQRQALEALQGPR